MKKIAKTMLAAVAMGILAISAAAAQAVELDAAIQKASKEINDPLFVGIKVALLSVGSPTNDFSKFVLDEMAKTLTGNRKVTIIAVPDGLRNEMRFQRNTELTDANALQIGQRLGAQFVMTGQLVDLGQSYRLRTKLLDLSNGSAKVQSSSDIRENAAMRRLLGKPEGQAVAPAAPAPAASAPAAPAPAPAAPAPAAAPAAPAPAPASSASASYKIGDAGPAGGIIFYDKGNNANGWRYLEAAPADIERKVKAVTENISRSNCNERALGRGISNTQAIMREAAGKGGGFGWAAQACTAFALNGFSDWFLPARDELNYMYGNLHGAGKGEFRSEWYWTSTASGSSSGNYFYAIDFSSGNNDDRSGSNEYRVRPIRQVAGN